MGSFRVAQEGKGSNHEHRRRVASRPPPHPTPRQFPNSYPAATRLLAEVVSCARTALVGDADAAARNAKRKEWAVVSRDRVPVSHRSRTPGSNPRRSAWKPDDPPRCAVRVISWPSCVQESPFVCKVSPTTLLTVDVSLTYAGFRPCSHANGLAPGKPYPGLKYLCGLLRPDRRTARRLLRNRLSTVTEIANSVRLLPHGSYRPWRCYNTASHGWILRSLPWP